MKCENCDVGHDGKYGSGRFCSTKCARGFSTKQKREEINEKVSNTLKKYSNGIERICIVCEKVFKVFSYKNRRLKICSDSCRTEHQKELAGNLPIR